MTTALCHFTTLVLVLCGAGCINRTENATSPDLVLPKIFGPETISTGNVYRGTFTPDDETFYYFKKITEGQEDFRIFRSELVSGNWSTPEQVNLGGDYSDLYPTISPDGKRIVFSSYRPVPGDTSSSTNANLWYADQKEGGWAEPVFMEEASTLEHYDAKPFFGRDGALYFETTTPDWRTTRSLITRWDGEVYRTPVVFETVEQWRDWRSDLYVWGGVPGPDESFIVLDISERDANTGHALSSDQWVSFRHGEDSWTEPKRLGSGLNSDGYDTFTFFSADGGTLFFVRDFDRFYSLPLARALKSVRE